MNTKRHPIWFKSALLGLDLAAVAAGSALAYYLRFDLLTRFVPLRGGYNAADYLRLLPAGLLAWFFALYSLDLYSGQQRLLSWRGVTRLFRAALGAAAILLAYQFFFKPSSAARLDVQASYSRMVLIVWTFCTFSCVVMARWIADRIVHHLRRHHHLAMARVCIAGSGDCARQVIKLLNRFPEYGRHVIGIVLPGDAAEQKQVHHLPVLGSTDHLLEIVRQHQVDEVLIAQPSIPAEELRNLLGQCERDLVQFKIVPDLTEMLFTDVQVEEIEGIPLLGLRETPLTGWNLPAKRLFDILASIFLLLVLSIPMAICAWLVRRSSSGPVLYRQRRVGADGREFTIYKFRSMVENAEELTGPVFSREDDPRVTPIGRFLRRHRIDEWPQLFNVLRGDMSLVGPRPERPFFVNHFKEIPRYMGRHRVKSGITGWAQVNGLCGPHGTIEQRLRFDIRYIEEWSWWLDFVILLRTIPMFSRPRKPVDDAPSHGCSTTAQTFAVNAEILQAAPSLPGVAKNCRE